MDFKEDYIIRETLSESDKCTILSAVNKYNGELVIIRIMYNADANILKPLLKINNQYVIPIYVVTQDEKDVIVIEKFLEGITIQKFLDNGSKLSEKEILNIFIQLCNALIAIHAEGIIHRDIKPSNIMLHNKNATLIDFDVARHHNPEQKEDTVYMGTKGYAAPEQYGFCQTDPRSDIYSLGVVINELLGDRINTAWYKHIIEKCTQFDPVNRYQSANEILLDIEIYSTKNVFSKINIQRKRNKHISIILKVIGYIFLITYLVIILQKMPHEVTVGDYFLSKLVYLVLVVFLFAPFLNLFKIRKIIPYFNNKKLYLRIIGCVIYFLVYILLLIITSSLAQALYSKEAKDILASISY